MNGMRHFNFSLKNCLPFISFFDSLLVPSDTYCPTRYERTLQIFLFIRTVKYFSSWQEAIYQIRICLNQRKQVKI
jgi:hypothetical protein